MSKGHPYPKEVLEFVRDNAANLTTKELVQLTNQKFGTAFTASKMNSFRNKRHISGKQTFSDEIKAYIRDNYSGSTPAKMAEQVNALFGTSYTRRQIQNYCNNSGLRTGNPQRAPQHYTRLFSAEVMAFICEHHKGVRPVEMAEIVNKRFGTTYTVSQITSFYNNRKLRSGIRVVPTPRPISPVGSERKGKYGELTVKVSMEGGNKRNPGTFRSKYQLAWEREHGPIPEGNAIICLDGDRNNCDLSNLCMVTRQEASYLNLHQDIKSKEPEILDARIMLSKVAAAKKNAEKKLRGGEKDGER